MPRHQLTTTITMQSLAKAAIIFHALTPSASSLQNLTVNQLTAYNECSHDGTAEWSICLGPTQDNSGLFFHYWYCPIFDSHPVGDPMSCIACPDDCQRAIAEIATVYNVSIIDDATLESIHYCEKLCHSGTDGEICSNTDAPCNPGYFCDASESTSVCKSCPTNISKCFDDEFTSSQRECYECQLACVEVSQSSITLQENNLTSNKVISNATQSHQTNVSAPLIDCSDLILPTVTECPAKNHICLIEDYTSDTLFWDLSQKAERVGCLAIIMFPSAGTGGHHSNDVLEIPYVFVSDVEEKALLRRSIGKEVSVAVQIYGSACLPSWNLWGVGAACNEQLPCENEGEYCDYRKTVQNGEYVEGWCTPCPTFEDGDPDPAGCFFDRSSGSNVKGPKQVESCASSCMANLLFDDCKFCPSDITGFDFGVENEQDQCHFCQEQVLYPDRLVPLFGRDVTCQNMQEFFERLEVHKDSPNCRLAVKVNHMCGCEGGPGYAGSNTRMKQAVLAWLPRVTAVMSLVGSSYIIL